MNKISEEKESTELRYALKDYLNLCQKYKKAILFFVILGALASGGLALTRNVYYLTTATFRDKGKPQTAIRSSLTDLIFSNGAISGDSETMSTLKSRKLLSKVIHKLGMQAQIAPVQPSFPNLKDIHDNFLAEYAYWTKQQTPILAELDDPIIAKQVLYGGEIPLAILIQFVDERQFKVLGREDLPLGTLDNSFEADDYSFVLHKPPGKTSLTDQMFSILFLPLDLTVENITSLMVVELDREDKTLLKLSFKHRDRHRAAEFLNSLMAAYQDFIKEDHEYVSSYQLEYLKNRQNEVGADLQVLMEKHAERLSKDLSSSGFLDSEKEIDFLAANVHSLQQKISEIDFEKKRLEKLADLDFVYYDQYGGRGDSAVINQLLGEIRGIKQQIDVLNLSLEKQKKLDDESIRNLLDEQFTELHTIRSQLKETEELSIALKSSEDFSLADVLFQPSQNITPVWFSSLNQINEEDQQSYKDQLCSYLDNLRNMLKLKEATISERIKHQHYPGQEFQGITLETARNLFYNYSSAVTELQGQIKQHQFIVEELKKPDFEVCSLTAILHDPISAERIAKASMLLINLRDENNRTQKEMSRLRDELNMLKQFLSAHIEQMIQLFTLREKLLQDKIYALQSLTLDLSYQQIYVLKKNLIDYLATRLENLNDEKKLIKEYQNDLNQRMAKIPSRWAAEKIVFQHLTSHQKFLENLSSMVESKNISKNLELIQSTPVDHAIPSINPAPPRAVFYAILGSLLGFLGSVGFLIARSLITGIPASEDNIKLAQMHCSGTISKTFVSNQHLKDCDLNTIRRSLGFLEQSLANSRKVLFILGHGTDPSLDFCNLLAKKGRSIIHLDLTFDKVSPESKNGLLQYIEEGVLPDILEVGGIHTLSSGGVSRYASELLKRKEFKALLETYQQEYDWTIAVSRSTILDADALNLSSLFDAVVIVIANETIEELKEFEEQLTASSSKVVDCLLMH
ncbi:MAG: hypothetical protein ACSNEK_03495 [Parachlamydiaceae bacterium]